MRKTKAKDPKIIEMNAKRAGWAEIAVNRFADETGLDTDPGQGGFETALYDLLVDLMHLCDVRDLNFDTLIERAKKCYLEEQEEL